MSYIGNTPTSQAFAPGTDTFSGTGSQTAFTLSRNVSTVNDILVVVNNVEQQPSNYTVSGTTLTFSPAPSSGTNNIYVRYLSTNLLAVAPQQGSVVPSSLSTGGPTWDTSGNVVGGAFRTVAGSGTVANSTSATLFTIPLDSAYMVTVQTGNASGLGTTAIVRYITGGNPVATTTLYADNAAFAVTVSGTSVRITNTLGGIVAYYFSAVRIL